VFEGEACEVGELDGTSAVDPAVDGRRDHDGDFGFGEFFLSVDDSEVDFAMDGAVGDGVDV
jgi:hypothetical protein